MTIATEQGAQGAPAPAVTTTPAAPAVAQPAASPAPSATPVVDSAVGAGGAVLSGDTLAARLARAEQTAREALLNELGVKDPTKAKAFIEAGLAAENEKKSLAEKLAEQTTAAATSQAAVERLAGIVALQATAQMSSLTPERQAAVKAIAGDDPAEQLRVVAALSAEWKAAPLAVPTPPAAPPPASTSPAPSAPPGVSAGSPPDHKAVHAQLQAVNPIKAAQYAAAHPSVFTD